MRRIKTTTADDDLFGTGKGGFTDGDSTSALPPTRLEADWFNNAQEEISRCVEDDGEDVTIDGESANYSQLDDAIGRSTPMFPRMSESRFIAEGLDFPGWGADLDVRLQSGIHVFDGRRYVVTGQKLVNADATTYDKIRQVFTFAGTPTDGNYATTFTGYGLGIPHTTTTVRAAGVPATNAALATQHAADITTDAGVGQPLNGIVLSATAVGDTVVIEIDATAGPGKLTFAAPSPGTLEGDPEQIVFTLTASMDSYFYISPEDPVSPADPPNRSTVHVEIVETAVDAGEPATPSGTYLFAKAQTNATLVTDVVYYNRGPAVLDEYGRGLRCQTDHTSVAAFVPHGPAGSRVDLGEPLPPGATEPDNGGYIGHTYFQHVHIRSIANSTQPKAFHDKFSVQANVSAAGTANALLIDENQWPDASSFYIVAYGVAMDETDPTDGYSFRVEAHAHIDTAGAGGITLDGTGGGNPPPFEGGAGGAAAGMDAGYQITSGMLYLRMTGHSSDLTRWNVIVEIVATGP